MDNLWLVHTLCGWSVACSSENIMCHIIFSDEQATDCMTTCEQATGHPHVSCVAAGFKIKSEVSA